tara:strand:- start:295 stop:1188 length:894 start_codon:yes stop_codon:yes gene_type:complete
MAYLGRGLDRGNYLKLDDLSSQFNGNTVTFNLTSGGQTFYPGSAYSILVSLAGIIQEPESAYIITNNTITFASPPQGSDDYFCIALGVPIGIGVPGQGSVNSTHLQTGVVTSEKIVGAAITSFHIEDGAVTNSKLSSDSVNSSNIVDGSITYTDLDADARGVGIQSGGVSIAGVGVTQLNFVGTGNTFLYHSSTKTIDISIQGGVGAGGTWGSNSVGIHTTKLVGINTTTVVGSADSEGALQVNGNVAIIEGALLTHKNIEGQIIIPTDKNALLIGPVSVGTAATIDVALGSVLVIV